MEGLHLLLPEIVLAVLGLGILLLDLVVPKEKSDALYHLGILAAGATLILAGVLPTFTVFGLGTLWTSDPMGLFLKDVVLMATLLTLMISLDFPLPKASSGTYTALVLWCTVGMMVLVSSVDLLLLFLALELVSMSTFVLAGFKRNSLRSSEGAIKYFLIGAFASAITAYGISLYYGATGTTKLTVELNTGDPLLLMSALFMTVGFAFKASLAPFHMWVPDAYEGAHTPITSFMSVAPKLAALGALVRVFTVLLPHGSAGLTMLFWVLAALTMTVGNLSALFQDNVKRLLAYSSVAQAGYLMLGFVAGDAMGQEAVLLYSLVYLFMNFGAFTVAILVGEEAGTYDLSAYDGLAQRNLGVALLMAVFLLSLAGIPPLAGFIGKFYLFAATIETGYVWLSVIAILNSLVSVYYYLRIAYRMFFSEPKTDRPVAHRFYLASSLAISAAAVLVLGVVPEPVIGAIKDTIRFLP